MSQHKTLEAAARAHGARLGVTGKPGGWLYRNGVPICQGWASYGRDLLVAGVITGYDAHGEVITASRAIRHGARSYRVNEPNRRLAVPDAVAVDTNGGYVFRNAEDGQAFTLEGAKAFAAKRNEGLKVPTYKVYTLTLVED